MSRSILDSSRPPVTNDRISATKNGVQMSSNTSPAVCATPVCDLLEQERDQQAETGRGHQGTAAAVRPPVPGDEAERGERAADQAVHEIGGLDRGVARGDDRHEGAELGGDRQGPHREPEPKAAPLSREPARRSHWPTLPAIRVPKRAPRCAREHPVSPVASSGSCTQCDCTPDPSSSPRPSPRPPSPRPAANPTRRPRDPPRHRRRRSRMSSTRARRPRSRSSTTGTRSSFTPPARQSRPIASAAGASRSRSCRRSRCSSWASASSRSRTRSSAGFPASCPTAITSPCASFSSSPAACRTTRTRSRPSGSRAT